MTRTKPYLLFLFLFAGPLHPEISQLKDALVVENDLVRVTIDEEEGTFSVHDKRIGYTWRPASAPAIETPEIVIQQTAKIPVIDGQIDDWTTSSEFRLTPTMTADAKDVKDAADLSARVRLCWNEGTIYMAIIVRDEQLRFCKPDEARWWEWDSAEFWIGSIQYGIRVGTKATTLWTRGKIPEAAQAVKLQTKNGYITEAKIPLSGLIRTGAGKVGTRFRFALGINDADADGGKREGQLYFPVTWTHSQPTTFATAVLGTKDGKIPDSARHTGMPSALSDVRPLENGKNGVRFTARCPVPGRKTVEARMMLTVPPGAAELVVDVDLPDRQLAMSSFRLFPPLSIDRPDAVLLFAAYYNGLAVPVTDTTWRRRHMTLGQLDLPWVGVTDGTKGHVIIGETPDDLDVHLDPVKSAGATLLLPSVHCRNSKGKFRYARRLRWRFVHEGGIVALAKSYREFARSTGLLRTLKEKMKKKPDVARLQGAPDIWGNGSLKFCREAKALGIERAIVNHGSRASDMEAIKALGYLTSVYDNYEDCIKGGNGRYGDVKIPDDCPIQANGEPRRGWLTWDKKKQFMKRCATPQLEVAKTWIPKDLEKHPYNARFLDVTTATGLRECYSPEHPLTRAEDRRAKRALARYVGEELGLVLGGEHGRFWGADLYDYWEGMQSGMFYSWPAGHVGIELPQTREDIGKRYLEWGLGHRVRVPLWELCFGDCVVSTWYWGDSTGHLYHAAPELAAKKDAFNILYGTVPLYWVSRPFGFNWSRPELRARLLESYRNTCKLHEIIGFEEMVGFKCLTAGRDVQQTRFSDGTVVTVNFGEEPFKLVDRKREFLLPQYGFHARGPRILQYKALHDGRPVTFIKTDTYAFGDGAGELHDFGFVKTDGRVALRKHDDGIRINTELIEKPSVIRPADLVDDWRPDNAKLLRLDSVGKAEGYAPIPHKGGQIIEVESNGIFKLVYGESGLLPDLALRAEEVKLNPPLPKQGEALEVIVPVTNLGGPARGVEVAVFVDGRTEADRIGAARLDLPSGKRKELRFRIDTTTLDGPHRLFAVVNPAKRFAELLDGNNEAELPFVVEPDFSLWPGRVDVEVKAGNATYRDWPVSVEIIFARYLYSLMLDPASIRVAEFDQAGKPGEMMVAQWEPEKGGKGRVWWLMKGVTKPGATRRFTILFARDGHGKFRAIRGGGWNGEALEITAPFYRARFTDGVIRDLTLRHVGAPSQSIWRVLAASSGETGWTEQEGKVTSFKVLSEGPVRTVIAVGKDLPKGWHYEKTYEFYASHMVVSVEVNKPLIYTRAFYTFEADYLDDKGNRARIDGKGDGEGIAGKNPNPQWYQVTGEGWANSCVALTRFGNISYWDPGGGQIGFTTSQEKICRVAYVFHGKPPGKTFAAEDAARLKSPPQVRITGNKGTRSKQ